jgi:hypothetical protein
MTRYRRRPVRRNGVPRRWRGVCERPSRCLVERQGAGAKVDGSYGGTNPAHTDCAGDELEDVWGDTNPACADRLGARAL